ncbi:MAG: hypothetical protein HFF18_05910 [Oscillospiraceae bacterium]|nr:hypothetical protein [Oscillospiraceae bacterium]
MTEIRDNWISMIMDGAPGQPPELPPAPKRPVTFKENSLLFYQRQTPRWIPLANECNIIIPEVVCERPARNQGGKDWFGVDWTYMELVHAPSVTPGFSLFEDIGDWREAVRFPDLDAIDWEGSAKQTQAYIDPNRMTACVLFNGCFERLQSMMGFENAACAMASEPEETLELINAIADFKIRLIDKLLTYYPIDRIIYHDDWGMQTSTFFSEKMFLELFYEPTKRIVDYTHSRGALFTMHSCGKVERFVPHMVTMDVDSWESAQMDINDLPGLKQAHGKKLNIETILVNPVLSDPDAADEEVRRFVRETIQALGKGGGLCFMYLSRCHPKHLWSIYDEYYKISAVLCGSEGG